MQLDPLILFFVLGMLARVVRSDLALPAALSETLTLVLLLAIGLKGGAELSKQADATVVLGVMAVVALGVVTTLTGYAALIALVKLPRLDAGAVAAHYGSVSVGTFAVATATYAAMGAAVEPALSLYVVALEAPAIVVGVLLARGARGPGTLRASVLEILRGKSLVLLLGGAAIGLIAGPEGIAPIAPLFVGGFRAVLALFLLDMGLVCGARLSSLRVYGPRLVAFAVAVPIAHAVLGILVGAWIGLGVGGAAMMGVLAASASYIAVPAAMRAAVPEHNPALSLAASLGITFPFNVLVGIPLYLALARHLVG